MWVYFSEFTEALELGLGNLFKDTNAQADLKDKLIKMSQTRRQTSARHEAARVTRPVSFSKGCSKIQWLIPKSLGLRACGDGVCVCLGGSSMSIPSACYPSRKAQKWKGT